MTVLTTAVLCFALILVLVMVDLLRALESKSRAQTAADAAALAAAQELARPSGTTPSAMAARYAGLNGATVTECRCERQGSEAVITVRVAVDLLFLGDDRSVSARARAVLAASFERR